MVEALVEQVAWLTPTSLFLLLNVVIATILVSNAFHKKPHQPQQQPQHHHRNNHLEDGRSEFNHQSSSTTETTAAPPPQPQLARTPSLFSRVTSFNYNNYYPYNTTYGEEHHNQQQHVSSLRGSSSSPSLFSRVASFNFSGPAHEPDTKEYQPEPELASRDFGKDHHVMRETTAHVVAPAPAVEVIRAPSLLSRVASFTLRRGPQEIMGNDDVDARREYVHVNNSNKVINGGRQESEKKTTTKKAVIKKKNNVVEKETTTFKEEEKKSSCHHHQEGEVDAKADDFINRFKQQLKLQRIESLMRYRSA